MSLHRPAMPHAKPAPADVIHDHAYVSPPSVMMSTCACGWSADVVNSHKTGRRLHAEHVIDELAEQCGVSGRWLV